MSRRARSEMVTEDSIIDLFDLYWFKTLILRRNHLPSPPPVLNPAITSDSGISDSLSSDSLPAPPPPTLLLRRHRRSRSDELAPLPALQIQSNKLNTIFSGKFHEDPHPIAPRAGETRARRFKRNLVRRGLKRRGMNGENKSLTDLEFEEMKGLMDLGFTFSEAEAADPRLISIVPGLQRLRDVTLDRGDLMEEISSSAPDVVEGCAVRRVPYLSEAWETAEAEGEIRRNVLLRNWKIPVTGEEIDIKDHLRLWAYAVAYAVR